MIIKHKWPERQEAFNAKVKEVVEVLKAERFQDAEAVLLTALYHIRTEMDRKGINRDPRRSLEIREVPTDPELEALLVALLEKANRQTRIEGHIVSGA